MRPGVIFLCLFSLFAALMAFSCNKDSIFAPFEGILETDEEANILGGDAGDWCYDTGNRIYYPDFYSDIGSFSLPCSTFGDSAQMTVTIISTFVISIQITASSSDSSLIIAPDTADIPAGSRQEFTARFHMTGDSVHTGTISFRSDVNSSVIRIGFSAGFVSYDVQNSSIFVVVPGQYSLYPAFPNPTSDITHIGVGIPMGNGHAILKIFDSNEDLITTLLDSTLMYGIHEVYWDVSDVAPGIYKAYVEFDDYTCQGDIEVR
jgi:hypothetical protein